MQTPFTDSRKIGTRMPARNASPVAIYDRNGRLFHAAPARFGLPDWEGQLMADPSVLGKAVGQRGTKPLLGLPIRHVKVRPKPRHRNELGCLFVNASNFSHPWREGFAFSLI